MREQHGHFTHCDIFLLDVLLECENTYFLEQKSTYKVWPILPPNAGFFFCERSPRIYQSGSSKQTSLEKLSKTRTVSALNPNEPPFPRGVCSWMMPQPCTMPRAAVALRSANCYSESIRNWTFRRHAAMQKMVLWRLPLLKLTCPHMFPENCWLKDEVSFSDGLFSVSGRVPCFFGILKCFRGPILYAPKVWLILSYFTKMSHRIFPVFLTQRLRFIPLSHGKAVPRLQNLKVCPTRGCLRNKKGSKLQETTPSPK